VTRPAITTARCHVSFVNASKSSASNGLKVSPSAPRTRVSPGRTLPQRRASERPRDARSDPHPSESARTQFPPKKAPRSQRPDESSQPATSNNLEDVIFLRLPDVKAITGLSKSSLYGLIREKSFPPPVRLGPRAVAWVRSEIRQWAAQRLYSSRSVA
jgi:predicted DNA-binding transcriptional regulator AlpA